MPFNINNDSITISGIEFINASSDGAIYSAETNETAIENCVFRQNELAVNISAGSDNRVVDNEIYNNTDGVKYEGSDTLTATHNWWGHVTGPKDQGPGEGDSVVGENVTFNPWDLPWARSEIEEFKWYDLSGGVTDVTDYTDFVDAKLEVSTSDPVRVFVASFVGDPGVGLPTDVGRYVDVFVNDTSNVTALNVTLYYTFEDMRGKLEDSADMYFWDRALVSYDSEYTGNLYYEECSMSTQDKSDSGIYTGKIVCNMTDSTTPSVSDLDGTVFAIGAYSDPVGGVALPTDKIVLTSTYVVAAVVAALGIAIAVRRKE